MDVAAQLQALDRASLAGLVRQALSSDTVEIGDWQAQPLAYLDSARVSGGLYRVAGTGRDRGEAARWSLVLKVVRAPAGGSEPSHYDYWRRELLAYGSGLLGDLPDGLAAPRCFGMLERPGDVTWLWLEDLADVHGARWPLARYGLAARHLGRFNGAYLDGRPLPSQPWLGHGWLRAWVAQDPFQAPMDLLHRLDVWEHPWVRRAFPRPVAERALRLWAERGTFLDALARLPQTFCHHDAYRPNLFARRADDGREQTVAIDWAFVGTGAVGEELTSLVAASLIFLHVDAADIRALEEAVVEGYLHGLRDAGWRGDPRLARLGYAASAAVRWSMLPGLVLRAALDESGHAARERRWGRPIGEYLEHLGAVTRYLLDLGDEARENWQ